MVNLTAQRHLGPLLYLSFLFLMITKWLPQLCLSHFHTQHPKSESILSLSFLQPLDLRQSPYGCEKLRLLREIMVAYLWQSGLSKMCLVLPQVRRKMMLNLTADQHQKPQGCCLTCVLVGKTETCKVI